MVTWGGHLSGLGPTLSTPKVLMPVALCTACAIRCTLQDIQPDSLHATYHLPVQYATFYP